MTDSNLRCYDCGIHSTVTDFLEALKEAAALLQFPVPTRLSPRRTMRLYQRMIRHLIILHHEGTDKYSHLIGNQVF